MTKKELIAQLKKLHNEEELAIPVYTKHLESTFFLSTLTADAQKNIKEMLLTLSLESEVHARMFESTIQKIQESDRDVY